MSENFGSPGSGRGSRVGRRGFLLGAGLATAGLAFGAGSLPAAAENRRILNVVAHQDDDLLFLNPDLLTEIRRGAKVRTVFLTAGDNGEGPDYYLSREVGSRAGYSLMAGTNARWRLCDAGIPGHPAVLAQLPGSNVSHVSLRLPDGYLDGNGTPANPGDSMQRVWLGETSTLTAVDGSSSYTRDELVETIRYLMEDFAPTEVRTQDYVSGFGGHDHSDHYAAAYFTRAASAAYTGKHTLRSYQCYETAVRPANVSGRLLADKKAAFYTYAQHDVHVCGSDESCVGSPYELWLPKQYTMN